MREIKFRAWDKTKKEMLEEIESTYDWEIMPINTCEDDYYVLMQYTGLKDKNGIKIYESDIIKYNFGGHTYTGNIIFDEAMFKVKDGAFINYLCYCLDIEVIGNIYENSELLNQ